LKTRRADRTTDCRMERMVVCRDERRTDDYNRVERVADCRTARRADCRTDRRAD
jgi:hypothetical protein